MMKNYTTKESQLERVVEQIFDKPTPHILEEIIELEAIVEIPVLQFEFILLMVAFFFCCGIERCTLYFLTKKIQFN